MWTNSSLGFVALANQQLRRRKEKMCHFRVLICSSMHFELQRAKGAQNPMLSQKETIFLHRSTAWFKWDLTAGSMGSMMKHGFHMVPWSSAHVPGAPNVLVGFQQAQLWNPNGRLKMTEDDWSIGNSRVWTRTSLQVRYLMTIKSIFLGFA